ncbi:hypothetical protein TSOC_003041 [Tetrabaena socialis]|uniref:Uncharacterized protein n=1 Tax=Tetrabaena socialis TaxID=47790 RepID=A0A2J8ACI3_9CHLO|nr:hypothetical protein TSOC_003041 [Tetrabaena socialis]|eukprot:PNH10229.1 hypothetical protein TSOC_003041 [Tetrabaena socialis]
MHQARPQLLMRAASGGTVVAGGAQHRLGFPQLRRALPPGAAAEAAARAVEPGGASRAAGTASGGLAAFWDVTRTIAVLLEARLEPAELACGGYGTYRKAGAEELAKRLMLVQQRPEPSPLPPSLAASPLPPVQS